MKEKIMEAIDLGFKYLGNEYYSLKDLNFQINRGDTILIAGNSGSGKSTLLNMISGIIPELIEGEMDGKLLIDGLEDLKIYERSLLLGNVFQNPRSQFFTENTTSEMVFEMENRGISKAEMCKRLMNLKDRFDICDLMDRNIFDISSGERQLLALLTVLIMDPDAVIFDEPSANLDYGNTMRLNRQIKQLKTRGKTVIVADHRFFYLDGIIDKVFFLEDKSIKVFNSETEFKNSGYAKRTFNLFSDPLDDRPVNKSCEEVGILKDVSYKDILKSVNFALHKREVLSLIGVNGAGKTTIARLICKILKPEKGTVNVNNKPLYIMQDADFQLFGASVLKELEITSKNQDKNAKALELLNIADLKDKHPQMLSGGEKQRLQMAISYVSDNELIIFDEPTSGLDRNSMQRVVDMINMLKQNRAILVISHDYEFIKKVSDRVLYLKDGSIEKDFYLEGEKIKDLNKIYKEMEEYYE